jgi:hypothetical protein
MPALVFPETPTEGELFPEVNPRWKYVSNRWTPYSVSVFDGGSVGQVWTKGADNTQAWDFVSGGGSAPGTPDAPTLVEATTTTLEVEVDAVSGATGYKWYLDTVFVASTSDPTYTFTGLTENTEYDITVSATNAYGESAQSAALVESTLSSSLQPTYDDEIAGRYGASSSDSTTVVTVSAVVPVGQRVVVLVSTYSNTQTVSGVTDSRGNTYAIDRTRQEASHYLAVCSAPVTTQLEISDTITVTWASPGFTNRGVAAFSLIDADSNTPDQTAATYQASTTSPSAAATTTEAKTCAIGIVNLRHASATYGSSAWTVIGSAHFWGGTNYSYYVYANITTAGSQNPGGTNSEAAPTAIAWVAYKK